MSNSASTKPPITKTGIQGFLLWFAREQPALYAKVAPTLPKVAPKAFSGYTARAKRLGAIYRSKFARYKVGVSGLADYSSYSLSAGYVNAPSVDPITVNYTAQLSVAPSYTSAVGASAPLYASYVNAPSYTAQSPATLTTNDANSMSTPTLAPIAAAANSGTSSTTTANAIGAVIGAAATVAMTAAQAAAQQNVVQTQLQRAAAGLTPLNTSLNALGVPTVAGTMDSGTLLLLGGAALLLFLLMGSKSSV